MFNFDKFLNFIVIKDASCLILFGREINLYHHFFRYMRVRQYNSFTLIVCVFTFEKHQARSTDDDNVYDFIYDV